MAAGRRRVVLGVGSWFGLWAWTVFANSTPDQIVQFAEAILEAEVKLGSSDTKQQEPALALNPKALWSIHFVAEGGVITPLSPSQANPTVYQETPALYNFCANTPANAGSLLTAPQAR